VPQDIQKMPPNILDLLRDPAWNGIIVVITIAGITIKAAGLKNEQIRTFLYEWFWAIITVCAFAILQWILINLPRDTNLLLLINYLAVIFRNYWTAEQTSAVLLFGLIVGSVGSVVFITPFVKKDNPGKSWNKIAKLHYYILLIAMVVGLLHYGILYFDAPANSVPMTEQAPIYSVLSHEEWEFIRKGIFLGFSSLVATWPVLAIRWVDAVEYS
jgi:hypothetical protein